MTKNRSNLLLILIVLIASSFVSLAAEVVTPENHTVNPAYLSTSSRKFFDLGLSLDLSVGNSYFALTELLTTQDLVFDLVAIHNGLFGQNLNVSGKMNTELHMVSTVMGVSVGGYVAVDGLVNAGIPNNVIGILANGFSYGEEQSGQTELYARIYGTAGLYGGYRWQDWQFSSKFGSFTPLVYTDDNSYFSYSALNGADGSFAAEAEMNFSAAMIVDPDNPVFNGSSVLGNLGYYMDFGAIRMKDDKPHYGFHLTGVTLVPARLSYNVTALSSASVSIDSPVGNFDPDGENDFVTDEFSEPEFSTNVEETSTTLPVALGGFYVYRNLPIIDITGYGGLTIDDGVLVTIGSVVEGDFFPLSILSLGLEYDRKLWALDLGVNLDVRAVEFGVDIGLTSPQLGRLFAASGVHAGVNMAFGW